MPYLLDQPAVNFKDRPILFIDLEMTGLDADCHEIIEVAALSVSQPDLQIANSYYTKIIPTHIHTADPKSLKVAGFDPKTWDTAIPLRQMLTELSEFAPNCLLAGWSVQNEWDFLVAALKAENLPYFFTNYLIEVWTLAYAKFYQDPEVKKISLASVAKKLGIYLDQHKPDSDIRATYQIFKKLIS